MGQRTNTDTITIGELYQFGGIKDSNAPTGIHAAFVCRTAEPRWAPEVQATATNGEGKVDSVTVDKRDKRQIVVTFTGYILDGFDPAEVPETCQWKSRKFIVGPISEPRQKGAYTEVSIEATSWAGVS